MIHTDIFEEPGGAHIPNKVGWSLSGPIRNTAGIVLSLVYVAVLIFSILVLLKPPRLELVLSVPQQDEGRITWIIPGGVMWQHGIRPGDQILALDGRSPGVDDNGSHAVQSVRVRTSSGETVFVDAKMLGYGLITWVLLLLSPWFFLLGLLVYVRAENRDIAIATQTLFANAAFALALAPASVEDNLLATSIEFVAVTLFAPCFLRFFLTFPTKRGSNSLHQAIFIPPFIVSVLGLISMQLPALYDAASLLRLGLLLGYVSVGVFLILYSLIVQKVSHNGVIIVGLGTLASVLPFILLYLAPTLFWSYPIIDAEYAIISLILLPISFAYAILRHNMLNITLIQRWLIHVLIWLGLIGLYTYSIFEIGVYLSSILPTTSINIMIFVALSIIFVSTTFQWVYNRTSHLVEQILFKDSYDYRTEIQNLSLDLSTARDIDTVGVGLLHTLRRLINVEFVALLLQGQKNQKGFHIHTIVGTSQPEIENLLIQIDCSVQESPSIVSLPINQNILSVPLRVHNLVIGCICVGPKVSGEPFRVQDRDLVSTLSVQIAAIIRNSQLVADLRLQVNTLDALYEQLQHAQEKERTRLAADIHDEPLQTAIHLQRQLAATVNTNPWARALIPLSQTLIDQLRNVCATMRPATLDDLGLIAALDALAQEQSDRLGVPIVFDIDTSTNDSVFTPNVELALYRAAQEAVNNSLRHAHPYTIHITLRQHKDLVQLLVTDDGQGFVVPDDLNTLVLQRHLGLIGMHERVERIGGQFSVVSEPGKGTTVQITIPLQRSVYDSGDVGR